jgi:peroxiredoxin
MRKLITSIFLCLTILIAQGQGLVNIGDNAPVYNFTKLINAPQTQVNIAELKGKPIALVFWGTWCAPCIPEMITLAKLQKRFGDKVQIIGVSNDNEQKIRYFLQKRPSKIWFASDPSQNLWSIFGINTAGHSALIDKDGKVVSITETHVIDSTIIQHLIDRRPIEVQENRGDRILSRNEDPINLDSSTIYSFVIQPALKGVAPMMRKPNDGSFANRRITIVNLVPIVILKEAFGISTSKRIVFSTKEDSIRSTQNPLCIDFIVSGGEKTNLTALFQKELTNHLPIRGEIQKKVLPCYVLRPIAGRQSSISQSKSSDNNFSFNGLEFEGEGIPIKTFVGYLENELNYPVLDATGLLHFYDIKFTRNNIEPLQSTKESLAKLGLELVKDQKEMDVLVISSR